ncbi:putative orfan [Tupanvirus soda lake]|uniref:Orfan n=2 Tax=Tupanvirus TaxID=2094720 RepID=A0AC62ABY6_9VIRU|nr:putative orfan [Tupanvirus soda lake]QKU35178.1 putative orfan [Tupanvirus soda lake]
MSTQPLTNEALRDIEDVTRLAQQLRNIVETRNSDTEITETEKTIIKNAVHQLATIDKKYPSTTTTGQPNTDNIQQIDLVINPEMVTATPGPATVPAVPQRRAPTQTQNATTQTLGSITQTQKSNATTQTLGSTTQTQKSNATTQTLGSTTQTQKSNATTQTLGSTTNDIAQKNIQDAKNKLQMHMARLTGLTLDNGNVANAIEFFVVMGTELNTIFNLIDHLASSISKNNPAYVKQIESITGQITYATVTASGNTKPFDPTKIPFVFAPITNTISYAQFKELFRTTQILLDNLINYRMGVLDVPTIPDGTHVLMLTPNILNPEDPGRLAINAFIQNIFDTLNATSTTAQTGGNGWGFGSLWAAAKSAAAAVTGLPAKIYAYATGSTPPGGPPPPPPGGPPPPPPPGGPGPGAPAAPPAPAPAPAPVPVPVPAPAPDRIPAPTTTTTQQPTPPPKDTTDYTAPMIALISYKIGSMNDYDRQLINYCQTIGLDTNATLAIYIAQNKKDVEQILSYYNKNLYYTVLMNILRLKKISAEMKFRKDYGITSDAQIQVLLGKQSIW